MTSAVNVFDFTIASDKNSFDKVKGWLIENCKKWTFQQEAGEQTGYLHWQGRCSLKVKSRLATLTNKLIAGAELVAFHFSITSDANKTNAFYVMKPETRVAGPWADTDQVEEPLPRDVVALIEADSWYPWQRSFIAKCASYEQRKINILFDPIGNRGKSAVVRYLCCKGLARKIPMLNSVKDIMGYVLNFEHSKAYIVDMPRAVHKNGLLEFWSALENVKDGYAFDIRYKPRERHADPPVVWVITNVIPATELLSRDRWQLWRITDDKELVLQDGAGSIPADT